MTKSDTCNFLPLPLCCLKWQMRWDGRSWSSHLGPWGGSCTLGWKSNKRGCWLPVMSHTRVIQSVCLLREQFFNFTDITIILSFFVKSAKWECYPIHLYLFIFLWSMLTPLLGLAGIPSLPYLYYLFNDFWMNPRISNLWLNYLWQLPHLDD